MNETNVRNEILTAIDSVGSVTMESSLEVLFSLADAYEKSVMITEHCTSDDLDAFSIFQEADQAPTAEASKPAENAQAAAQPQQSQGTTVKTGEVPKEATRPEVKKTENAPQQGEKERKGFLWFIPNLLRKIWQFLKDTWNGVIVPKAQDVAATVSEKTKDIFEQVEDKDESWIKEHAKELGIAAGGTAMASLLAYVSYCKKDDIKEILQSAFSKIALVFKAVKTAPKVQFSPTGVTTDLEISKIPGILGKIKTIYTKSMGAVKDLKDKGVKNKEAFTAVINAVTSMTDVNSEDCRLIGDAKKMTYESFLDGLNECVEGIKATGIPEEELPKDDGKAPDLKPEDETDVKNMDSKTSIVSRVVTAISTAVKAMIKKVKKLLDLRKKVTDDANNEQNGTTGEAGATGEESTGEGENIEGEESTGENTENAEQKPVDNTVQSTYNVGDVVAGDDMAGLLQAFGVEGVKGVNNNGIITMDDGNGGVVEKRSVVIPDQMMKSPEGVTLQHATYSESKGGYVLQESAEDTISEGEETIQESAVEELTEEQVAINNHWYR